MPAADNIRSCREPSFLKTEASLNEIIWNGANPPLPQPAHAGSPLREGAIVCKGEKGRQCPAQLRCINMRCAPAGQAHPRETKARRPAEPKRHSQPKSAPAAKAAAAPGRIAAHTRDEGQAPSPIPSGTATPNAHRRRSRRSCTRQDIRTNARHRPSTQPNPSGTANPRAHRRHSRRSSTRQVNRTRARQRPSTHPKPKRRSQPKCAPAAKPPQLHPAG